MPSNTVSSKKENNRKEHQNRRGPGFTTTEVTRRFHGKLLQGVMIVREEDEGLYRIKKAQRNAVKMNTCMTDAIELRPDQAENMYQKAFQSLLASGNDVPQDFVIGLDSSTPGGSKPCSILLNSKFLQRQEEGAQGTSGQEVPAATVASTVNEDDDEDCGLSLRSGLLGAFGSSIPATEPAAKAVAKAKPKQRPNKGTSSTAPSSRAQPTPSLASGAKILADLNGEVAACSKRTEGAESMPPPKSKRGRVNPTILAEQDGRLIEEVMQALHGVSSTPLPTSSESEMITVAKMSGTVCNEIINKCTTKLAQMKRRKGSVDEEYMEKLGEYNQLAAMFGKLFSELASSGPKLNELSALMSQAEATGYVLGRVAVMKLAKANIFELVKYNRYSEIPAVCAQAWNKMDISDESGDSEYFQSTVAMLLEQVVQKLLRTIPATQVKVSMVGALSLKAFLVAIADDESESLSLSRTMVQQVSILATLFKSAEDKTILPSVVLEGVGRVQKPAVEERLFLAMKSLPQGTQLLQELSSAAKKRMASDSSLEQLARLRSQIMAYAEQLESKGVADAGIAMSSIVETWDGVLKLEGDLKDKAEAGVVSELKSSLATKVAKPWLAHHAHTELADFVASQFAHAKNGMKCQPLPSWDVLKLRKFLPLDESLFRTVTVQ